MRRRSSEEQRELLVRDGDLTALAQHPGWAVLEAQAQEKREEVERRVLTIVLAGRGEIDTAELQFQRGFLSGLGWLLTVQAGAERRLETTLKRRGAA